MEQNNLQEDWTMNEKIYNTMSKSGACNLVLGIVILVTGIAAGVMMIVNGANLLKKKSKIMI
jgi:hypothetical protein